MNCGCNQFTAYYVLLWFEITWGSDLEIKELRKPDFKHNNTCTYVFEYVVIINKEY